MFLENTATDELSKWLLDMIVEWGVPEPFRDILHLLILLIGLVILLAIVVPSLRKMVIWFFSKWTRRSETKFDDYLVENRFFWNLIQIIPYLLIVLSIPLIFHQFPVWIEPVTTIVNIYGVILALWILRSFLRSVRDYSLVRESLRDKPLNSYVQVIMVLLYIMGGLLVFSLLTGRSLWTFITAMGAASAILLLVFKDSILGFVASIQVAVNDMVRVGDWIQMDKYGADGDVIEIGINTVKVRNWDKTITTIPTYNLVSDSFINWRGMQESGGRRIKRPIYLKISSIRFLKEEEIEALKKIQLLTDYIENRQAEILEYNEKTGADPGTPVNGRHLTNVGLFRKYVELYARRNPGINKEMSFMVRQLSPTAQGLPMELYFFANTIKWVEYEGIVSDMFDHLLAAVKYFHLEVFEKPASDDLRYLLEGRLGDEE